MARHVVGRADALAPGERMIKTIAGRSVGIFNVEGTFFALRNRCPHQGAELCSGRVLASVEAPVPGEFVYRPERPLLRCPWHGWEFDMRTGQSWFDPKGTRVRTYGVTVESGEALGEADVEGRRPGPYTAETYLVAVEADYLVIDV